VFNVQSKISFPFLSIRPVTLQTVFGKDRPNVLVEADIHGRTDSWQHKKDDNGCNVKSATRETTLAAASTSQTSLDRPVCHFPGDLGVIHSAGLCDFKVRTISVATFSGEDLMHNPAVHIGQTVVAAGVPVR
jgi:hypothetical protein